MTHGQDIKLIDCHRISSGSKREEFIPERSRSRYSQAREEGSGRDRWCDGAAEAKLERMPRIRPTSRPRPKRPAKCPKCGSANVRPVVYGLPSTEAMEAQARGELAVEFGGCVISGNDPRWFCTDCRHSW